MNARKTIAVAGLLALGTLASCAQQEPSGPPTIRLGRDECVKCGMSIVEDRFSCALLVLDRGHLDYLLFDDIGDMLDHERANPDLVIKQRFVHDFNTRAWRVASESAFAYAESVHTPMGSGLAAFADKAAAQAHAAANSGKVLTFEEVAAFRVAWRTE